MGSPANSSSLITSNQNPLLLPLSACSQLLLLRLSPRLMPMLSMATMAMDTIWDMPTMDTMDTHMPTVDTSMARDLLMLSQRPRLMLMLYGYYGYAHHPYAYGYAHHGYYYGKRSADAEPEAKADADAFYGYYGYA